MTTDATTVVVGLDVGTTGVKAIAVAPDGEVVARAEHGYPLSTPRPGWSEQDPEDWWRATRAALADLGPLEIAGIGLSGQMHGLVALDAAGRVVRPAILWNDQRTAAECAEIEERIGLERLIALTGNRALTGFTAPKLLWLRRHEPDAYARIARDHAAEGLRAAAAHGRVGDRRRRCVGHAAARRRRAAAGRPRCSTRSSSPAALLPPLLESPEVSGATIACDDVSRGIPVAAGAGDCAAAALGVGIDRPGPLSIVLGTSGVVFAALPGVRAPTREARVHAFCHAVPGQWHAMGVMLSAAGSLQWLRDRARAGGRVRRSRRRGGGVGARRGRAALRRPTSPASGRRTPTRLRARRFTGLELRHDRGALVRAVLEGVAFGLRDSLELVRELGGPRDSARASGGGARGLWLRDRRLGARPPDRADRRRGRLGVRRRAPRRGRRRRLRRRATTRSPAASASGQTSSPTPPGRRSTKRRMRASARCTPPSTQ